MRHQYNLKVFQEKNALFYYLLGVFLTDGNISVGGRHNKFQLTSSDKEWLKLISNYINCPVYPTKDGHGNLTINSKEICSILLSHGCVPNKSLVLSLPEIPAIYNSDFIRGCIDGDGSIPKTKKKQCYICSSSYDWLISLKNIFSQNNIKSNIYEIKKKPYTLKNGKTITPRHKHYRLMTTGTATTLLLSWAYYFGHQLSMPRKNEIAQSIISGVNEI